MSQIKKEDNRTIFQLEDPAAYRCFTNGLTNKREWARHQETADLGKFLNDSGEHNVIVQFGDTYTKIR